MTVKQIASAAAVLLAADGIVELLNGDALGADDPDIRALVKCVETAVSELYTSGFSPAECERLTAENGLIATEAFSKRPTVIRAVTQSGNAVRFTFDSRGVTVLRDGAYDVLYVPERGELSLGDEVTLGGGADVELAAQLTARNYCLVTGRADEARVWDGLYADACGRLRTARRARMRPRVWA